MQKIEELIAALEMATGPSRELDCAIAVTIDGYYEIPPKWEGGPVGYGYVEDDGKRYVEPGHGGDQLVPHYTASIDAAVALVNRVLPGKWPDILHAALRELGKQNNWHICLVEPGQERALPIAILIEALKAKLSQEKNNADK